MERKAVPLLLPLQLHCLLVISKIVASLPLLLLLLQMLESSSRPRPHLLLHLKPAHLPVHSSLQRNLSMTNLWRVLAPCYAPAS
jgi:hypothetical protein